MKKLIIILVLLAYGFASFGMTLHVHYCCGKIDAVKLVPVNDDRCPADHKEKKEGCCDDKQLELKINTDYKNELSAQFKLKIPDLAFTQADYSIQLRVTPDLFNFYKTYFSQSAGSAVPLYSVNCIYRI